MNETVGDVMRKTFGSYDYVVLKGKGTTIRRWDKVTPLMEARRYESYKILDGLEMSKEANIPSDKMSDLYLVFVI